MSEHPSNEEPLLKQTPPVPQNAEKERQLESGPLQSPSDILIQEESSKMVEDLNAKITLQQGKKITNEEVKNQKNGQKQAQKPKSQNVIVPENEKPQSDNSKNQVQPVQIQPDLEKQQFKLGQEQKEIDDKKQKQKRSIPQKENKKANQQIKKTEKLKQHHDNKEQKRQQKSKQQEKATDHTQEINQKKIVEQWFDKYDSQNPFQIKPKILYSINNILESLTAISSSSLNEYLKNAAKPNFKEFQIWFLKYQQSLTSSYIKHLNDTKPFKKLNQTITKVQDLLGLVDKQNKSSLALGLQIGEGKGKTNLKYGVYLKEQKDKDHGLIILIEVKSKKKGQLKSIIEEQIKNSYFKQDFHVFKLCKISFTETEKALQIHVHSPFFEQYVLKIILQKIDQAYENNREANHQIFRAQGQLSFKNSLRVEENSKSGLEKKFVKWTCDGVHSKTRLEGNRKTIKYFTSILANYFPALNAIRSGQINLKLKGPENVDKFFEKLGINQICEQTPSLRQIVEEIVKSELDQRQGNFFIASILQKIVKFQSAQTNERISFDIHIDLSHLKIHLAVNTQGAKEMGQILQRVPPQK